MARCDSCIDADGRLGGLPADVPEGTRAEAELALAGTLTPSTALDGLQGTAGTLMGGTTDAAAFGPLSPVGTVVESDRPAIPLVGDARERLATR